MALKYERKYKGKRDMGKEDTGMKGERKERMKESRFILGRK